MSRLTAIALAVSSVAAAHTVSMSTSRLDVQGTRARLEIRVPAYEVRHVAEPARTIPAAVQIDGAGPSNATCAEESGTYVCRSEYAVTGTGPLRVHCLLAQAIVANHVHVMHATRDGRIDQAVFDATLEDATLRFRAAGPVENAVRTRPQMIGVVLLVMLAAGILGASRRDALIVNVAVFVAAIAASAVRTVPWQLTPGFLETAIAVLAAYAAFEVIAMQASVWRAFIGVALGVVLGRYAGTLAVTGSAVPVIAACVAAAALTVGWIAPGFAAARRFVAWVVLAAAIVWIAVALVG